MRLRRSKPLEVKGFLDNGTEIIGDLKFSEILHFHGKLKGRIISDGELVVGENGIIEGDVEVGILILSGTLHGNIVAKQKAHLLNTSRVYGDIRTPILKVDEGATWEGTISTTQSVTESKGHKKNEARSDQHEAERVQTL